MVTEALAFWPKDQEQRPKELECTGQKPARNEVLAKAASNKGSEGPRTSWGVSWTLGGACRRRVCEGLKVEQAVKPQPTESWSGLAAQAQPARLSPKTKITPSTDFRQDLRFHNSILKHTGYEPKLIIL